MIFSKWHGLGNDFILVEPEKSPHYDFAENARFLCDRHFGIGADGLVTIRPLGGKEFEMRIFNSDGSECEMCGNATRCVALYIQKRRLAPGSQFDLHTQSGVIRPTVLDNGSVRVDMGMPRLKRGVIPVVGNPNEEAIQIDLETSFGTVNGSAISMGNPHFVIYGDKISDAELTRKGSELEKHPIFPNKCNIEFVEIISPMMVRMRVWERGCGITMACGTGSCATVVAGVLTNRTARNLTVLLDGGELQLEFSAVDNHVYMTGPAQEVFRGETPSMK